MRRLVLPFRALVALAAVSLASATGHAQTLPTARLASDASEMAEDGGTTTLTATLRAPAEATVVLTLRDARTAVGTGAALGADYVVSDDDAATPGPQIVIEAGRTTGSVTVTGIRDDAFEGPETAALYIASASGARLDPACLGEWTRSADAMASDKRRLRAAQAASTRAAGCLGVVTLLDNDPALVGDNGEADDAGNVVDGAAMVLDGDATSFFGQIGNGAEPQPANDADCFTFNVVDAEAFGAELFDAAAPPRLTDSQFHLFDADQQFVLFDDDSGSDSEGFYSRFFPGDLSAVGGGPGLYTLCVTSWDNDAVLDAGGTLIDWNDDAEGVGNYRVEMTGVGPAAGAVVQFANAGQVVSEGAGSIQIEIVADGLTGPVAVTVTLVSGDPTDLGGFASATTTLGQPGTDPPYTVTVPITDDAAPEPDETFTLALSVDAPNQVGGGTLALVVLDNDREPEPVVATVPGGPGLRVLSLPIDGVTVGDVAEATGADRVFLYDAAAATFAQAPPGTVLRAGQPILVDVVSSADLTFSGVAATGPTPFDQTPISASGGTRVLVPIGNPSEAPIALSALTLEGGTLADVALVFDAAAGAFVPLSLAGIGCCEGGVVDLFPNEVLIVQVVPSGDPDDVRVLIDEGAAGGLGDSVTEAAFEPTEGETAVVLELRPSGTGLAEAPGDVFALRLAVGGDSLDTFDGFDVTSPLGGTLASPDPADPSVLFAALSRAAPTVATRVTAPLTVRVPTAGAYEIALVAPPRDLDGQPIVVEVLDGPAPTVVEVGLPFRFAVAEGDSPLVGRFAVRASLRDDVSTEAGPDAPALTVYPNPSSGRVTVSLSRAAGAVRVAVYDALGREVVVLHDGPAAGPLDATLEAGRLVPGAYVVRAVGSGVAETRPLTVVR